MLPQRIPKKPKRSERWRSQAHCSFVRSHRCIVPGCHGMPIEVMHVRRGSDAGTGRKPSDFYIVSGCKDHHAEQHSIGEQSFERKYGVDLMALASEFAKASPRRAQIEQEKRERGHGA